MSKLEREPACGISYCPAPTSPDWHRCLICDQEPIHHHHVEPRGMGGSRSRTFNLPGIIALCVPHHEMVTTDQWYDAILELPGQGRCYYIADLQGQEIFQKPLSVVQVPVTVLTPPDAPHTTPVAKATRWRASDLTSVPDSQLAQEFDDFYAASGILKLEAYRRIEAYRLKYAGVAGDSWVQKAKEDFGLQVPTLKHYARAWQAFEQAVDQTEVPEELADSFRMMGGGVWQVIGRLPEETWPQMSEIALNVVANSGVGRGLPARVAAKGQEEGLVPKADNSLRCPSCGNVAPKGEYEKVSLGRSETGESVE